MIGESDCVVGRFHATSGAGHAHRERVRISGGFAAGIVGRHLVTRGTRGAATGTSVCSNGPRDAAMGTPLAVTGSHSVLRGRRSEQSGTALPVWDTTVGPIDTRSAARGTTSGDRNTFSRIAECHSAFGERRSRHAEEDFWKRKDFWSRGNHGVVSGPSLRFSASNVRLRGRPSPSRDSAQRRSDRVSRRGEPHHEGRDCAALPGERPLGHGGRP